MAGSRTHFSGSRPSTACFRELPGKSAASPKVKVKIKVKVKVKVKHGLWSRSPPTTPTPLDRGLRTMCPPAGNAAG
jgi:hypothetical protein